MLFTSAIVYPNAVQSYHGPMAKFKTIPNAQYIKVERILANEEEWFCSGEWLHSFKRLNFLAFKQVNFSIDKKYFTTKFSSKSSDSL